MCAQAVLPKDLLTMVLFYVEENENYKIRSAPGQGAA